ncbi:hypothetical protein [Luteimonas sp. A478]
MKQRTEQVLFRTAPGTSNITITLDPTTGRIASEVACEFSYAEVTYDRENPKKSPKVVARIFGDEQKGLLDVDQALLELGKTVAIDTNTINFEGRRRSVVGIVLYGRSGVYASPYCIELADLRDEFEERIGWMVALNQLAVDGFIRPGEPVGLVVDANLGDLVAINRREQGLMGNQMLADGWTMSYASADAGGTLLSTELIKAADRASSLLTRLLVETDSPMPDAPPEGALWGTQKVMMFKNSFKSWAELDAIQPETRKGSR